MRISQCTLQGLAILIAGLTLFSAKALYSAERPDTNPASRLGQQVQDFTLDDYRGRARSLSDWSQAKCVVVVFLGTDCPLVKLYLPRLAQLATEWEAQGVAVVGINSNQQDPLTKVAAFAQRHEVPYPILKDPANQVADQFGALRTPEAFVLDGERRIRYRGRIDDQFGIGYQKPEPQRRDLAVAVEEVLAGKDVSKPYAEAPGCLIGRVKRPDPSGDVTYSKQIARLLQRRCVECHHEGQVAPFSLTSYDEVAGWAEMIREVVHERRMPPWLASPEHGRFKNNPSLTDEELRLLDEWIDNGCPEGDPADLPEPIELATGWGISEPDDVFYMSDEPFTVPAEGTVQYQYYTVDPGFTEDRWIREAEVRAGNPAVVHHVIVFIDNGGGAGRFGSPQMAYAPGMPPRRFEPGMAIRAPAGSKLIFQVHYTPNGTEQQDRSYVGFVYADPDEVTHEVLGGQCGTLNLKIPPGEPNYEVVARHRIRRDTVLLGLNPHMHVRGKSFRYELEHPDGTREVLLDVPRYDFNWQLWYNFEEPKLMPAGSRMVCTATFDNSPENLANPDPTATVTWGEQTWDEMMFGFYSIIKPRSDADDSDGAAGQ